jgi:MSHA pilin protein MshA
MKRQQSGFTLIELIMVIVVLGILAAFALPRFANFGDEARYSTINGALGAVRSASAIVHSAALAKNFSAASGEKVVLEGQDINLAYGYIAGTVTDVKAAAQLSSDFTVTLDSGAVEVKLGACSFTYKPAASATGGPVISALSGDNEKSCPAN